MIYTHSGALNIYVHTHQDRCKHQVSRVCNLYVAALKVR